MTISKDNCALLDRTLTIVVKTSAEARKWIYESHMFGKETDGIVVEAIGNGDWRKELKNNINTIDKIGKIVEDIDLSNQQKIDDIEDLLNEKEQD